MYERSTVGPAAPEPRDIDRGGPLVSWLRAMWTGDVPLVRVFWEYAIVYGTGLNLLTTIAAFALMSAEAPSAASLAVFFLPLPYNLLMLVAVWRSAGRYGGPKIWADLARGAIVVWVIAATAI